MKYVEVNHMPLSLTTDIEYVVDVSRKTDVRARAQAGDFIFNFPG